MRDYLKDIPDEDLWIVAALVGVANVLQLSDQPLDLAAQRLGEIGDLLIDSFAHRTITLTPVANKNVSLVVSQAA